MIILGIISFLASTAGAISGIGGGVIIKPILDMAHILSVKEISFLSGCTVLSMTVVSVGKSLIKKENSIDIRRGTPLAIGAAFGGVIGKLLFSLASQKIGNDNLLGLVQSVLMLLMIGGTFFYTIFEKRIHTLNIISLLACTLIGAVLGIQSAFLGIGGGPANLVVLSFFFSMERKKASVNSLYIILFSQIFSLAAGFAEKSIPEVSPTYLVIMVMAGILGGFAGGYIYKKMSVKEISKIFSGMMVILIIINMWNVFRFSGIL